MSTNDSHWIKYTEQVKGVGVVIIFRRYPWPQPQQHMNIYNFDVILIIYYKKDVYRDFFIEIFFIDAITFSEFVILWFIQNIQNLYFLMT
jgi:hypothetical protein